MSASLASARINAREEGVARISASLASRDFMWRWRADRCWRIELSSDVFHGGGRLRTQRCREEAVAQRGVIRGEAAGRWTQRVSMDNLVEKRGRHLQNGVGESELENLARDRFEGAGVTQVDLLPALFSAGVGQEFEPFGVFCGEPSRRLRAVDLDIPSVLLAGGDPLGLERPRESRPLAVLGFTQECGIVPRLAWHHPTFSIRALLDDF